MYVFQCDRCREVGGKHGIDLEFTAPDPTNKYAGTYGKPLREGGNTEWGLCDACTDAMAHFMHQPEDYGDVSTAVVDDLKFRIIDDLELGAQEGWTPEFLADKFVQMCRQKMVLDRQP